MENTMNDLLPEDAALLDLARDGHEPTRSDRTRVRAALIAKLGVGAGLATAASTSATATGATHVGQTASSAATAGAAAKVLGMIAFVAVVGGGAALAYRAAQRPNAASTALPLPPSVKPSEPSTALPAPLEPPPVVSPLAVPRPTTPKPLDGTSDLPAARSDPREKVRPTVLPIGAAVATTRVETGLNPSSPGALPPLNPTTLEAETRLVRAGIAALREGDPADALDLFDEHARTYPNGVLAEERAAERITALCHLDRVDEANRAAATFVREHSGSPLVARVRSGCAGTR
jgi:hypothetical protein